MDYLFDNNQKDILKRTIKKMKQTIHQHNHKKEHKKIDTQIQ